MTAQPIRNAHRGRGLHISVGYAHFDEAAPCGHAGRIPVETLS